MKLICVHTSTNAFDDHRVDLKSESLDVQLRFKSQSDFDKIKKGDEVEISIGESATAKKAAKKKKDETPA